MIANIIAPKNISRLLILSIFILYFIIPITVNFLYLDDPYVYKLTIITAIAISGIISGSWMCIKKREGLFLSPQKFKRNSVVFLIIVFTIFLSIYFLLIVTSDSIPIISAIQGADPEVLSEERGQFLKQRSGFLLVASYIFSVLISSVIPFCIILLFEIRSKLRVLLSVFIGFVCVSFLVKAMFLNLVLPLLSYWAAKGVLTNKKLLLTIGSVLAGVILLINLAGFNKDDNSDSNKVDIAAFLAVSYEARSSIDFFVWRAFAIPILAARDTLVVHETQFSNKLLGGATSGTIARLTGAENINIERIVFAEQYGGWNDIGNTNAAFMVDAYVNFGYFGVFFYGIFAAFIIYYLTSTPSIAMSSMALLFVFFLLGTSLVGIVLSNGFFVLFAWLAYQKSTLKFKQASIVKSSLSSN